MRRTVEDLLVTAPGLLSLLVSMGAPGFSQRILEGNSVGIAGRSVDYKVSGLNGYAAQVSRTLGSTGLQRQQVPKAKLSLASSYSTFKASISGSMVAKL